MTSRAAQVVEVEYRIATVLGRLVTVDAGNGRVFPGQRESRLLVPRYVEGRGVERGLVVTALAAVEVWSPGELIAMYVAMTIDTLQRFDPEHCRLSRWDVALGTLHISVFRPQRKLSLGVVGDGEPGGPEPVDGMAGFATPSIGTSQELSLVRIGPVAVRAGVVGDRRFEVSIPMTRLTRHFLMSAKQRILCLRVVELCRK